ncbi:MAG: DnaA regulatory inactivator Hda [Porticoccaceae bacterium]|nr:DnaA regulatory inactivator Hda [Porticoccaceae bacterium]
MSQLSLAIALDDQATFDNFYAPTGTPQYLAAHCLREQAQAYVYLSGALGTGLSHLLQAACQQQPKAIYLSLQGLSEYPPEDVLRGLESSTMVCLDDFDEVATEPAWQQPLFHFFNRCNDSVTRLILAAHCPLDALEVPLPDLLSRLKSGVALHFSDYRDADLRRLMQYRANRRGLYLSNEIALFILNRTTRSTRVLMAALNAIDRASLQSQRRITLPLVKATLGL